MSNKEKLAHELSDLCKSKLVDFNLMQDENVILEYLLKDKDIVLLLNNMFFNELKSKEIMSYDVLNMKRNNTQEVIDMFLLNNNVMIIEDKVDISNSKDMYMYELKQIPLYTPDEENEMFCRLENGEDVKAEIVKHYLRLVVFYAKTFSKIYNIEFLDLIQEGNIGLIKAVDKYDLNKGYRFSTYATWWIKQVMYRSIHQHQGPIIEFPIYYSILINKYNKFISYYYSQYGCEPKDKEVCEYLDIDEEKLKQLKKDIYTYNTTSLNTKVGNGMEETTEMGDFIVDKSIGPDEVVEKILLERDLFDFIKSLLTEREFDILITHNNKIENGASLQQLGDKYGLTRERVRQIKNSILTKLRNSKEFRERFGDYYGVDTTDSKSLESLKNVSKPKKVPEYLSLPEEYLSRIKNVENLNHYERACLYEEIRIKYKFSLGKLANFLDLSISTIKTELAVLKYPKDLVDLIKEKNISLLCAQSLLKIRDNKRLYFKYVYKIRRDKINSTNLAVEINEIINNPMPINNNNNNGKKYLRIKK